MPGPDLGERLPEALPSYDRDTTFSTWLRAHEDEVDALDVDVEEVQKSLQVAHATGDELDRIGSDFGILGRRRGRGDEAYRQYLMTLVAAFRGRGRIDDVRFAIASGLTVEKSAVTLDEDFQNTRYTVVLTDWKAHKGSTVEELAQIADPSAVDLHRVRYDVGVDEALASDAVTVDSGLSVDEPATTSDAIESVDVGDAGRDRWQEEKWAFMEWSSPDDFSRDAGTDTATTADGVAVDPNETTVADTGQTSDAVDSISTQNVAWGGDWGAINWGNSP